jgi:hypothetical protein
MAVMSALLPGHTLKGIDFLYFRICLILDIRVIKGMMNSSLVTNKYHAEIHRWAADASRPSIHHHHGRRQPNNENGNY